MQKILFVIGVCVVSLLGEACNGYLKAVAYHSFCFKDPFENLIQTMDPYLSSINLDYLKSWLARPCTAKPWDVPLSWSYPLPHCLVIDLVSYIPYEQFLVNFSFGREPFKFPQVLLFYVSLFFFFKQLYWRYKLHTMKSISPTAGNHKSTFCLCRSAYSGHFV